MENLIRFFMDIGKLKVIKRLGWILGGTKEEEAESIADHSFRLAVMAWILGHARKDLDVSKVLKMAILHDFPVVNTGDITPYDDFVSKGEADMERLSRWPRRTQEEKKRKPPWFGFLKIYRTSCKLRSKNFGMNMSMVLLKKADLFVRLIESKS